MAIFQQGNVLSRKSGAALTLDLDQYTIVKTDASGFIVKAAAATDALLGTLMTIGKASGDTVSVGVRNASGTLKVRLGGTVAKDAYITSNASGLGIATTTAGNEILGRAMEAGVSGQVIEYLPMTRKYVTGE